ncbi:unnamed protein product [Orchesella dallaii]|uniref:ADP-ribosylation factor-like protein 2-binding protein n=1 Tax=Orchesella dallaii TaxID=48710 RepID=A0ABP1R2H7_9HEXA
MEQSERRGSTTFIIQEESSAGAFLTPAVSISIDEGDEDDPSCPIVTTPVNVDDEGHPTQSSTEAYQSFDTVVGAIEDVAVGSEFQALQSFYLSKYWKDFEGDENSESTHEQFMIFQNYSKEMAHLIETHVKRHLGNDFSFSNFIERWYGTLEEQRQSNNSSINSLGVHINEDCSQEASHQNPTHNFHMTCEIESLLFTLTDFCKFKELMIDYRKMLEGKTPTLSVTHQRLDLPH